MFELVVNMYAGIVSYIDDRYVLVCCVADMFGLLSYSLLLFSNAALSAIVLSLLLVLFFFSSFITGIDAVLVEVSSVGDCLGRSLPLNSGVASGAAFGLAFAFALGAALSAGGPPFLATISGIASTSFLFSIYLLFAAAPKISLLFFSLLVLHL